MMLAALMRRGGWGDVFKHTLLSRMFLRLRQLDRPFTFVDFFPGHAASDLTVAGNEPLNANCDAVGKLWSRFGDKKWDSLNDLDRKLYRAFQPYLRTLRRYNLHCLPIERPPGLLSEPTQSSPQLLRLHHYPGNALFAHYFLRRQDNAILVEPDAENNEQVHLRFSVDLLTCASAS